MIRSPLSRRIAVSASMVVVLAGCSDASRGPASSADRTAEATPSRATEAATSPAPATSPPTTDAADLGTLSLPVLVGQVFMTATEPDAVGSDTVAALTRHHVGNVMLRGRGTTGVEATADTVRTLRRAEGPATGGLPLLVATDQEGGLVQVLRGRGFSDIPRTTTQGSWSATTLTQRATAWGRELRAAGVDLNLAPVLDTVPSPAFADRNAPIGYFDRQFGFSPAKVTSHGLAFLAGMEAAGVIGTVKHFPGLGRVTANTDTTSGVRDTETTATDPYLEPFRAAIAADAKVVMMSTAYYDKIDPRESAAFSRPVVTGLLRERLGFDGVVISDDLSAARQVTDRPPARRALDFLRAGGDLVLAIDPGHMAEMTDAVVAEAEKDSAFRTRVEEAAGRVVALKREHASR
ncbi:glycoside hydrolase family 3 N-terminal domain-containing protein [Mumia quercus]|uniref:glycoside hydrolase family 3 N-terminal domain-containing protein n=1 Tax=Mumia quercus TaxID=2976125 RepID=UPI0021D290E7|nr:glycoside hydrolase family 3 N-terminal domain-containing protein [Mumia quercus]